MPSEASSVSWSHLLCGGPNGILLVILALAWWMKCSMETNPLPIEEAALDITWVLARLRLALNVSDKSKKRQLERGPDESDDIPSAKRYLILSQYLIENKD